MKGQFVTALDKLESASSIDKPIHQGELLDLTFQLLKEEGGSSALYEFAPRFGGSGIFADTDWALPGLLQSRLVRGSLTGEPRTVAIESLNQLRFLAIAQGDCTDSDVSPEKARTFLTESVVQNLDMLFDRITEESRGGGRAALGLLNLIVDTVGLGEIFEGLVDEVEAVLAQRPVRVTEIKSMISRLSVADQDSVSLPDTARQRGRNLASALFTPSPMTATDPGVDEYKAALMRADINAIENESRAMTANMHAYGIVSDYHAALVRFLRANHPDMLVAALGVSEVGRQSFLCFRDLILALVDYAVHVPTAQAIYGLNGVLERGTIFNKAVAAGLWRMIDLSLRPAVRERLAGAFGHTAEPEQHLMAGLLGVLGHPLGVGQGDNPTCQSARAISLWAQNDPDYLIQLVRWAGSNSALAMSFEGKEISSEGLQSGLAVSFNANVDAVSVVLVPHLDRIYAEMCRLVEGRDEDGHKWINPAFHGWWVPRGCACLVDINTGAVRDFEKFIRLFYAAYHPLFNGNLPVLHAQPAGIAATDAMGEYIGSHAVSIERLALDADGNMRVYFNNPNDEGRQHWGGEVSTSVKEHGELPGESSLPVVEFASRLYLFHYDPLDIGDGSTVSAKEINHIAELARESWAKTREWV